MIFLIIFGFAIGAFGNILTENTEYSNVLEGRRIIYDKGYSENPWVHDVKRYYVAASFPYQQSLERPQTKMFVTARAEPVHDRPMNVQPADSNQADFYQQRFGFQEKPTFQTLVVKTIRNDPVIAEDCLSCENQINNLQNAFVQPQFIRRFSVKTESGQILPAHIHLAKTNRQAFYERKSVPAERFFPENPELQTEHVAPLIRAPLTRAPFRSTPVGVYDHDSSAESQENNIKTIFVQSSSLQPTLSGGQENVNDGYSGDNQASEMNTIFDQPTHSQPIQNQPLQTQSVFQRILSNSLQAQSGNVKLNRPQPIPSQPWQTHSDHVDVVNRPPLENELLPTPSEHMNLGKVQHIARQSMYTEPSPVQPINVQPVKATYYELVGEHFRKNPELQSVRVATSIRRAPVDVDGYYSGGNQANHIQTMYAPYSRFHQFQYPSQQTNFRLVQFKSNQAPIYEQRSGLAARVFGVYPESQPIHAASLRSAPADVSESYSGGNSGDSENESSFGRRMFVKK